MISFLVIAIVSQCGTFYENQGFYDGYAGSFYGGYDDGFGRVNINDVSAPIRMSHLISLGDLVEETKEYRSLNYEGHGWIKVPVINGYAPQVSIRKYTDGRIMRVYRYTQRIPYETCMKNQPEINQPEINQPEINQPEINQPEINQPEINQPEINQPEINQPEINQPEINQPQIQLKKPSEVK